MIAQQSNQQNERKGASFVLLNNYFWWLNSIAKEYEYMIYLAQS
jgi:hypothetical protein